VVLLKGLAPLRVAGFFCLFAFERKRSCYKQKALSIALGRLCAQNMNLNILVINYLYAARVKFVSQKIKEQLGVPVMRAYSRFLPVGANIKYVSEINVFTKYLNV
jgi:hypothetical protein